jgi:hypothetical protein
MIWRLYRKGLNGLEREKAMHDARWIGSALWPFSVWTSFAHFGEHAADDYVERTAPIVAVAIAFWIIVGAIIALLLSAAHPSWLRVLLFFLPVTYLIGFSIYSSREDKFRQE